MEKIISALKKPAKLLLLIFVGAYALFEILWAIGRMDAGGGGIIAGGLFFLIIFGGLVAALIVALLKKNEAAARFIGLAFFGFLAFGLIYGLLGGPMWDTALASAVYAFDFIASLAGIAIFAMLVLGLFLPKLKDNKIVDLVSLCALLGFLFFSLLARLMEFGVYGQIVKEYHDWGMNNYHYPWYSIVSNIGEIMLLGAILFGYLMLFVKTPAAQEAEAPAQVDEVPADEPVLEAEVEEPAPEEPAQEPAPEEPVLEAEVEE